jgi:hypothetical protein
VGLDRDFAATESRDDSYVGDHELIPVALDDPARPTRIKFRRSLHRVAWWTLFVILYGALYCCAIFDTDWFIACGLAHDVVHPELTEYTVLRGRGSSVIRTGIKTWEWMQDFDCIWYFAAGVLTYSLGWIAWVVTETLGRPILVRLLGGLLGLMESVLSAFAVGAFSIWLVGSELVDYLIEVGWVEKHFEPERTERVIPWWSWILVALGAAVVYTIAFTLGMLVYQLYQYLLPQVIELPDVEAKARSLASLFKAPPDLVMMLMQVRIPLQADGHLRSVLHREFKRWCDDQKVPRERSLKWAAIPDWIAADVSLAEFHLKLAAVNNHGERVRETDRQTGAGVGLYAAS